MKTWGKVTSIDSTAIRTFFTFFRFTISRNTLSQLNGGRVSKNKHLVSTFIRIAIPTIIITWFVLPVFAQGQILKRKVLIAMDSPLFVYDPENKNRQRTNIDEIIDALKGENRLVVEGVKTSLEWRDEAKVKSKNPDLITLHLSAFDSEDVSKGAASNLKLLSFFQYMADSNANFLVYTRSPYLEDDKSQQAWIQGVERRIPQLKNRIKFINFIGRPKRFRDYEVKKALLIQVKTILGIS